MARHWLLQTLRWVWILAVSLGAYWIWETQRPDLTYLGQESAWIVAAAGLTLAGKICVAAMLRILLVTMNQPLSFGEVLRMYSYSDVGKYIPGGIWAAVGRATYYARINIARPDMIRLLLLEQGILVIGACSVGAALMVLADPGSDLWLPILAICAVLAWTGARMSRLPLRILGQLGSLSLVVWLCVGLGFAFLAPPGVLSATPLQVVGSFDLAFAAGLLAIFAPAGAGVRELVLYLGLPRTPDLPAWLILSRAVWLAVDLSLAGLLRLVDAQRKWGVE